MAGDPRRARREAAIYMRMTYTDAPRVAAVSRRLPPSCNNPRGGDCEPQTTVELGPSAQRLIISMNRNRTTRSAWQAGMTAACAIVLTVLAALVAVGCGSAAGGGGGARRAADAAARRHGS